MFYACRETNPKKNLRTIPLTQRSTNAIKIHFFCFFSFAHKNKEMASTFLLGHPQKLTVTFSNFTSTHKQALRSQNVFLGFPSNGGQCGRLFIRSPITMAKSNNKSDYPDDKKRLTPLKMAAGASLALTCALSIFGLQINNMSNTAAAAMHPSSADMIISGKPTAAVSSSSGMNPLPAKYALRSLFEVSSMLASAKPIPSQRPFSLHKLPSLPSKEDIDSIKVQFANIQIRYLIFVVTYTWVASGESKQNDDLSVLFF